MVEESRALAVSHEPSRRGISVSSVVHMGARSGASMQPRTAVYCLVSPALVRAAAEVLGGLELAGRVVELIPERRSGERRCACDRRCSVARASTPVEHRRVRNREGRRIGERRGVQSSLPAPVPGAEPGLHADEFTFVAATALPEQEREDLETGWLVTRIQAGEQACFNELHDRLAEPLHYFLEEVVEDWHAAEDLTQTTFTKAWEALPAYEHRGTPFRAWLFQIARNSALHYVEKQRPVVAEDPTTVARLRELDTDEFCDRGLELVSEREFREAVSWLPPVQRRVVMLRYVFDLDYATIAQLTQQGEGALREAHSQALASLRPRFGARSRPDARRNGAGGDRRTRLPMRGLAAPHRAPGPGFSLLPAALRWPRSPAYARA